MEKDCVCYCDKLLLPRGLEMTKNNVYMIDQYRSGFCGEVGIEHVGKQIVLCGFVAVKRDHGQLVFLDLRDHTGIVQCIFEQSDSNVDMAAQLAAVTRESVVQIEGVVYVREVGLKNEKIATGDIEVRVASVKVLSLAKSLPFDLDSEMSEEAKLRWRYLYLRGEQMQRNLKMRADLTLFIRNKMTEMSFMEVQTPILTGTSPEGARDFLVPSRLHKGKFYALPQAPQQFKQLLMASGVNKYFQIAPCFRDEDSRADRSPGEFYQLDCEIAYASQDVVLQTMEHIVEDMMKKFWHGTISHAPFPILTHDHAMEYYCSDKPDLRNPLKFQDVTEAVRYTDCHIFQDVFERLGADGMVKVLYVHYELTKPIINELEEQVKKLGLGGLAFIKRNLSAKEGEQISGTGKKLFESEMLDKLLSKDKNGYLLVFAGQASRVMKAGNYVRCRLFDIFEAEQHKDMLQFCFVVDFPMFEYDEDAKQIIFSHNPFSMPKCSLDVSDDELLRMKAWQYDLVCNGIELASGAIRNHKPDMLLKAFSIAGYTEEAARKVCDSMLHAFVYGVPPHGGFAIGLDRLLMILCGATNIREVIAFPLTQNGQDLLMHAPSTVADISYLGLRVLEEIGKSI